MATSPQKSFKINIMGLIILEGQNCTARELLLVISAVMLFVLSVIIVLKVYVLPVYGIGLTIKKAGILFVKLKNAGSLKSGSP